MSNNLKKISDGRWEYECANGAVLAIQRPIPAAFKGGVAIRVKNSSGFAFVNPEDMAAVYEVMREAQKRRCGHCDGTGSV